MSKAIKALLSLVTALFLTVALSPTAFADNHGDDDPGTIVDIAVGNDDFSILVSALQRAELVETLQGDGPFTVFAPTNEAFADLLEALDITAEELLAQPDLANVLLYHVVAGEVFAENLEDGMEAETVNGEMVTFDLSGDPMVNDSNIIQTDIEASNGVIHVIDSVLVPSNFTLQDVEMEEEEVPQTGIESNTLILVGLMATAGAFVFIFTKKPVQVKK
ncbi:MAG: fasciclin domain-containing protein [Alkalibacterium sp.]|nr:fasciclin domain-containing protein [Alkalibacterium sp.]TVP89710.1 MAG: fasciclin domain-containing protein [Alkalibacterium sp.]